MIDQLLSKSNKAYSENRFTSLSHDCLDDMEPVVLNWELLGKLGPSFGIVGTITAMINIFAQFGGIKVKLVPVCPLPFWQRSTVLPLVQLLRDQLEIIFLRLWKIDSMLMTVAGKQLVN